MVAKTGQAFIVVIVLLFFLSACGAGEPNLTSTSLPETLHTSTPTRTATPTVTFTPTDTPRPTLTTTFTPEPTLTSTPTRTPTHTTTPIWCPLEKTPTPASTRNLRVVYLQGGNIWLWDEAGERRALTQTGDVISIHISSDGEWVAFERQMDGDQVEIWAAETDAEVGTEDRLVSVEQLRSIGGYPVALGVIPYDLTWVPGSHTLAFNSRSISPTQESYVPDDLWMIDVEQGRLRNVLAHGKGGKFVISPDGKQIALLGPRSLSLVDIQGGNLRRDLLPEYQAFSLGTELFFPLPAWAPDSRSLRVGIPTVGDLQTPNPQITVWEVPLRGFKVRKIESFEALPASLSFAPDLSRAAFIEWPTFSGNSVQLHIIDLRGGEVEDLLYRQGSSIEFLGWAPDSQRFAFWMPTRQQLLTGHICAGSSALSDVNTDIGKVDWVDAERFLFVSGETEARELRLGRLDEPSTAIAEMGDAIIYDFVLKR